MATDGGKRVANIFIALWAVFLIAMWLGFFDGVPEDSQMGLVFAFSVSSLAVSYITDLLLERRDK